MSCDREKREAVYGPQRPFFEVGSVIQGFKQLYPDHADDLMETMGPEMFALIREVSEYYGPEDCDQLRLDLEGVIASDAATALKALAKLLPTLRSPSAA